jgi:hypothetical protein
MGEIPRPVDEDAQKEKYSGKKKKHTVKNAVIISCCRMVLFVSQTCHGSVHDRKIGTLWKISFLPALLYIISG